MKKIRLFTLLELVCVMVISALLIGLVIGRVGKIPAYLNFKNSLDHLCEVMNSASNLSEFTGQKVVMVYNDGFFRPQNERIARMSSDITYKLPSFINVSFDENVSYPIEFIFFSDGSSYGPDINFSYKGHTASFKLSKLTGVPILNINE